MTTDSTSMPAAEGGARGGHDIKAVAVIPGTPESAHLAELAEPRLDTIPEGRGVLVRVLRVGLDGTDKEINAAAYGPLPRVLTSWLSATRALVSSRRSRRTSPELRPGDHVVAIVRQPGDSLFDAIGRPDLTTDDAYFEHGISRLHGLLTDRYVDSPEYLVRVPAGLGGLAVLLEPTSVVEKGLTVADEIQRRLRVWRPRPAAFHEGLRTSVMDFAGVSFPATSRAPSAGTSSG